jgi:hypothetical protein
MIKMAKFKSSRGRKMRNAPLVYKKHLATWTEVNKTGNVVQVFNYVKTPVVGCKHESSISNGESASCVYCHQDIIKCCGEECDRIVALTYSKRNWKSGYCASCQDDYVV